VTSALAGGSFQIGSPGLLTSKADGVAITVGNNYEANVGFLRPYLQLATRTPAMPEGGDSADDVFNITDPHSGLSFQVCVYRQYKQVRWEVGLAWGVKAVKGDGIAVLLG
jgi:hypothetical protein